MNLRPGGRIGEDRGDARGVKATRHPVRRGVRVMDHVPPRLLPAVRPTRLRLGPCPHATACIGLEMGTGITATAVPASVITRVQASCSLPIRAIASLIASRSR